MSPSTCSAVLRCVSISPSMSARPVSSSTRPMFAKTGRKPKSTRAGSAAASSMRSAKRARPLSVMVYTVFSGISPSLTTVPSA